MTDVPQDIKEREQYFCMNCNGKMIAKKGPIISDHFAIYSNTIGCGSDFHDQVLMQFKAHFETLILKNIPQPIWFNCNCGKRHNLNILKDVIYIKAEQGQTTREGGKFRPDISLIDESDKILMGIEIVNKNPVGNITLSKYREADISCIEIHISNDRVEEWREEFLDQDSLNLRFDDIKIKHLSKKAVSQLRILKNLEQGEINFSLIDEHTYGWDLCEKSCEVREFFMNSLLDPSIRYFKSSCVSEPYLKCKDCIFRGKSKKLDNNSRIRICNDHANFTTNMNEKLIIHFWGEGKVKTKIITKRSLLKTPIPKFSINFDLHNYYSKDELENYPINHSEINLNASCSDMLDNKDSMIENFPLNYNSTLIRDDMIDRRDGLKNFELEVDGKIFTIKFDQSGSQDKILQILVDQIVESIQRRKISVVHNCLPIVNQSKLLEETIRPQQIPNHHKINDWLVFSSIVSLENYIILEGLSQIYELYPMAKYQEIRQRTVNLQKTLDSLTDIASGPKRFTTIKKFYEQISELDFSTHNNVEKSINENSALRLNKNWDTHLNDYVVECTNIGFDTSIITNHISEIAVLLHDIHKIPALSLLEDYNQHIQKRTNVDDLNDLLRSLKFDTKTLCTRIPAASQQIREISEELRERICKKLINSILSTDDDFSMSKLVFTIEDFSKEQIDLLLNNFTKFESKIGLLKEMVNKFERGEYIDRLVLIILRNKLQSGCWKKDLQIQLSILRISEGEMYSSLDRLAEQLRVQISEDGSKIYYD